jgi:hypothetical protein
MKEGFLKAVVSAFVMLLFFASMILFIGSQPSDMFFKGDAGWDLGSWIGAVGMLSCVGIYKFAKLDFLKDEE